MKPEHLQILRSPESKKSLQCKQPVFVDGRIRSGVLTDGEYSYPIIDYIPRFVPYDNYCSSFTLEWEKHPDILYGKYSNYSAYEERFHKETRWEGDLRGEVILEAGCGPGAFTRYALETGATVVSFDASRGVEKSHEMNGKNDNCCILQASIYEMPFPDNFFDRIFCFGVLQHTPDPRGSLRALVSKLKPGGQLACDIYSVPPSHHPYTGLLKTKYFLRRFTRGKEPNKLYRLISHYVGVMWPITRVMRRIPKYGIQINRKFLFDDYDTRLTNMDRKLHKEFARLDIFDMLSPAYDLPSTVEELGKWYQLAGLDSVEVHFGYNGIEGRGRKPIHHDGGGHQ